MKDVADVPKIIDSDIDALQYERALVAMDIGGSEDEMLSYLSTFSKLVPVASMQFLHVVPETTFLAGLFEKDLKKIQPQTSLSDQVVSLLTNLVRNKFEPGSRTKFNYEVKEGDPLAKMLNTVDDMQADLLVIGQRSGKSHHGILAKKLVRKAKCDALVIPESAPSDIKHILVPIDFSVHSGNALRNAVALAQRLGDDVVIQTLHVYTLPDLSAYQIDRTYDEYHGMLLENLRDAQNAFFENYIPGDRGRIKVELVYKDMPGTARYIKQFAEESNTDFVVMGAKGHSTVDRLLIGSITEAFMMINKEIPTLIIR